MANLQKISPEKAHAEFSASGSQRWLSCPGSIALCKKAPEAPESKYAAEGTKAHACLEFLLNNRQKLSAALVQAAIVYDEEMIEHAHTALLWIDEQLGEGDELLVETKVDASSFTCKDQFGTLDVAIVREFDRLTVIDYKYGAGVAVDPEIDGDCNPQLAYYALGVSDLYNHNFSEVELVVIQPRAYNESGEVIRSAVFPISHLLGWGEKFLKGVKACQNPKATLSSGKWCKFCPAATICPEIKDAATKKAQIVFAEDATLLSVPEPKMIIMPQLSQALDACEKLEAWITKVRDHAIHVLEKGHDIEGFKLVEKRSPRRWVDIEKASMDARRDWGEWAFTEPKLLSPAQLEKKLKGPSGESWVAHRVTDKSSGLTLVRESDKRLAVKPLDKIFGTIDG